MLIKFLKAKASEQSLWLEQIKTRISLKNLNGLPLWFSTKGGYYCAITIVTNFKQI